MNKLLIPLLVQLVQQLVSAALFQFIQHAVMKAEASNDPGDKKRMAVIASVANTGLFQQAAGWAVNLAIETAVARLKLK